MDQYGQLSANEGDTEYPHIPDWYKWERECVWKELVENTYLLDIDVDIYMLVNTKCVYRVGEGHLIHNTDGFTLTGCDGQIDYHLKPQQSYSIYSDFYWYEIGDVIGIGDNKRLYYCFPKQKDVVMKARFATEELYKMLKNND